MRDERAISEVISFALVFSLIASTVAVVYVSGIGGIQNTRNAEQFDNAERAFDVLADNVKDLYQDGAPSRATEMKLGGSTLSYGESTTITVTVENVGSPAPSQSVSLEPIVYRPNGQDRYLVYEAGAVVRTERGGSLFTVDPPFLFTESGTTKTALFPLVQTRREGSAAVGGQSTVLVRTHLALSESLSARTDPTAEATSDPDGDSENEYDVTVTIETTPERAPVWRDYLETEIPDSFDSSCTLQDGDGDGSDETVECSLAVERLFVSASRIDVAYE